MLGISLTELEIIRVDLFEQPFDLNTLDMEFDDDDPEADIQATTEQNSEEEKDDTSDENSKATLQQPAKSQTPRDPTQHWRHRADFSPQFTAMSSSLLEEEDVKKPMNYFTKYFSETFFNDTAENNNKRYVLTTGASLNTNADEIRKYWAASIAVSLLCYPKIRMC